MDKFTSLKGPVETQNGELVLLIPLAAGGREMIGCSHGISEIDGDYLKIVIRPSLAEKLRIKDGSLVHVDNQNGKFNVYLALADV